LWVKDHFQPQIVLHNFIIIYSNCYVKIQYIFKQLVTKIYICISDEANKFIRGNSKVGKPLELVYEYTREQDLNELEQRIQKRFIEYSNMKT